MKAYPPEIRAKAEAMLLQGDTPKYVGEQLSIPEGSVKNWQRALKKSDLIPAAVDTVPRSTLERLGDLVMSDLETGLETSKILKQLVRNERWLGRQSAHDVAILIGVIEDKNIRKLEAIERAGGSGDE
jgi:hypothetical protein